MDQLSTFNDQTPLIDLLAPYVRSHTQQGRRVRALDIGGKGRQLTTALAALLATSTEQLLNIAA